MLTATLFDMDGLLLDSEILWHKAELKILGDLGVPIPHGEVRLTKGMFVSEVVDYWFAQHPWDAPSRPEVVAMILQAVGDLVESEGVMMPGALRAIELASERGPIAVASSTPMPLIMRCLENFNLVDLPFDSLGRHRAIRQTSPRGLSYRGQGTQRSADILSRV